MNAVGAIGKVKNVIWKLLNDIFHYLSSSHGFAYFDGDHRWIRKSCGRVDYRTGIASRHAHTILVSSDPLS